MQYVNAVSEKAILACAQAAHEVNRAYCRALGDLSQFPWEDAPEWQRRSAIDGVGLALKPDTTPELQHEAWCKAKCEDGWVYGAEKDPVKKTHPCLVPYTCLPEPQRRKDALYQITVRAIYSALT